MPMQIVTATGSPVYFVNTDGWPSFDAMARVCGLSVTGTMQVGAAVRVVTPPDVIRPTTITMAEVLASQISKKEAQALASAWRAGDLALGLKTEICRVIEMRARGRWTNGQDQDDSDSNIEASVDLHRRCAERRGTQLGTLAYLVEVLGTKHRVRMHEIMPMDIAIHPQSGRRIYIEASAPAFRGTRPDEDEASRGWTLHYIAPTDTDPQGAIGGSISGSGAEWFTVLRLATLREPPIPRHPDRALGWRCATCWCLNLGAPGAEGDACKGCGSTTRERAIYAKHVTEGIVPESEQTTMSRYTYEEDDGSRITIRDGDATVSIVAGVPMSEIDPGEEEAVVVLNPTPEKAREIARWLELYAKAVEAAR